MGSCAQKVRNMGYKKRKSNVATAHPTAADLQSIVIKMKDNLYEP